MKKPGWITVVGVIGLIIGFFGILGTGKSIVMPRVIEFQKEVLSNVEKAYDEGWRGVEDFPPEEFIEIGAKLLDLPDWFYTWSIVFGLIGFFVYGYYLFTSIWLLLIKKSAVRLFYIAIALSICFSLLRTVVASFTNSLIGFFLMAGSSFVLAVNIVLLIVVAASDKRVFATVEAQGRKK